jgi:hypothetical protein
MKLSLPAARIDIAKIEVGTDIVMASAKFICQQASAAADEFSITFD